MSHLAMSETYKTVCFVYFPIGCINNFRWIPLIYLPVFSGMLYWGLDQYLCNNLTPQYMMHVYHSWSMKNTSIPNDSRDNLCTDDNYRGIALYTAIGKIIDIVIINKYKDKLVTSELQFACKSEMSSIMCTTILKEVCSYYQYRKTFVFVCMLDASKAFDRVHYGKLFDLLRKRKLPATVIRLLFIIYTRQRMRAVWNGNASVSFSIENGVKQGGILSPTLFMCLYRWAFKLSNWV